MTTQQQRKLKTILSYAVLIGWTFTIGFPIYWLIMTAFKTGADIFVGARFFPWIDFTPTLDAFEMVFIEQGLLSSMPLLNSIIVSVGTAAVSTVLGGAAGYALARFPFKVGRLNNDRIATAFLVQRMMPAAVLLIPFLIMFKTLGLLDTRFGLTLAYSALTIPFVVWIMRDFFAGIPTAIEESALIDGCGRVGVLFRIAIPLAAPGFVSAFVLSMIGAWNEFLIALCFMFNKTVTIPMFMMYQMSGSGGGRGPRFNNIAVVALFAAIPITAAGLALERYITRGLTYGAVK